MSQLSSSRHQPAARHAAIPIDGITGLRIFVTAVLAVIVFFVSWFAFLYKGLADEVSGNAIDTSSYRSSSSNRVPQPIDSFNGKPVNILVAGIDSRYGPADSAYGDVEELSSIQSDTVMVVHISADRQHVQVVSIPRDIETNLPSCTRSDGSQTGEMVRMFNSAFGDAAQANDIAAGIACTQVSTEYLTGLTIDGFLVVDFAAFINMVNAIGGVWIDIDGDIDDSKADIHLTKGCQKLNGKQALGYARVRYGVSDGSDLARIGRQHKFLGALMREVRSKNYLTDLPKLYAFLKQTLHSVSPSQNLADLRADMGLLLPLASIPADNLQFVMMPNSPAPWNENRVVPDEPYSTQLWEAIGEDKPLPPGTVYKNRNGEERTVPDPSGQKVAKITSGNPSEHSSLPHETSDNDESTVPQSTLNDPGRSPLHEKQSSEKIQTCPPDRKTPDASPLTLESDRPSATGGLFGRLSSNGPLLTESSQRDTERGYTTRLRHVNVSS